MNNELARQCLEELKVFFSDEHCSIQHSLSFWPEGCEDKDEETTELIEIQIGLLRPRHMFRPLKFQGTDLNEVMDEVRRFGYEDRTCSECNYGPVDNEGLCVIDSGHPAIRAAAQRESTDAEWE